MHLISIGMSDDNDTEREEWEVIDTCECIGDKCKHAIMAKNIAISAIVINARMWYMLPDEIRYDEDIVALMLKRAPCSRSNVMQLCGEHKRKKTQV